MISTYNITQTHGCFENTCLTIFITDNKIIRKQWKSKDSLIDLNTEKTFIDSIEESDYENILKDIHFTFKLIGGLETMQLCDENRNIIKESKKVMNNIYEMLCDTDLPTNFRLIKRTNCGCSNGNCMKAISYKYEKQCEKYDDLFGIYSDVLNSPFLDEYLNCPTYQPRPKYIYDNGALLCLETIIDVPKKIKHCYSNEYEENEFKLDENCWNVSYYWMC